jgi:hypothetical protein
MSTLVLMLTAAMAVPGNGPEKVSGEMEQGLDLRGRWEGTFQAWQGGVSGEAQVSNGKIHLRLLTVPCGAGRVYEKKWQCTDEGEGKLLLFESKRPGIYRQHGDHIIICFRASEKGRPAAFQAEDDQYLLILHRVKSRK